MRTSATATPMVHRPAVAGYFYPSDADALCRQIDALTPGASTRMAPRALLLPHGSVRHAGAVIGSTLARVTVPRRCLLLGPSHTGSCMSWSVMERGAYRTPLGEVPIDEGSVDALRMRCPFISSDPWAQQGEHAIEVLLPFLQRHGPADLMIVPLIVNTDDRAQLTQCAEALAQVIRMQEEPALLIASADLSHYEPQEQVIAQDRLLMERLCALDTPGFSSIVEERSARVCGSAALACVLIAARQLGATQGTVAAYQSSAEAGGDPYSAIGYAGIIID